MNRRSLVRLFMAGLWLVGGIVLAISFRTEGGMVWQSYPASIICFLMVAYNLLLTWYYGRKQKPEPADDDAY